jgi:predicted RNA binding protein YcfA (HicA-like mRNA interferase family)
VKAVSGKDLAKALERKGWTHTRTRGSHHVYASPDGQTIAVVPIHGNQTLPIGTQRGIMKDAGLTEADL